MKEYKARKKCKLGATQYYIGDAIPQSAIEPKRIGALLRLGIIQGYDRTAADNKPAPQTHPTLTEPAQIQPVAAQTTEYKPRPKEAVKEPKKPAKRQPKKTTKAG